MVVTANYVAVKVYYFQTYGIYALTTATAYPVIRYAQLTGIDIEIRTARLNLSNGIAVFVCQSSNACGDCSYVCAFSVKPLCCSSSFASNAIDCL